MHRLLLWEHINFLNCIYIDTKDKQSWCYPWWISEVHSFVILVLALFVARVMYSNCYYYLLLYLSYSPHSHPYPHPIPLNIVIHLERRSHHGQHPPSKKYAIIIHAIHSNNMRIAFLHATANNICIRTNLFRKRCNMHVTMPSRNTRQLLSKGNCIHNHNEIQTIRGAKETN